MSSLHRVMKQSNILRMPPTLSLLQIFRFFSRYIYIYLYLYHGFNCHSAESISFGRRNCLTYFLWILSWSVTLSNWTYKVKKTTPQLLNSFNYCYFTRSLLTFYLFRTALKLDHTKVLDTSQVFKYEYSGVPPKENNGYFETCIEFESIQPRRPSLDFLCKVHYLCPLPFGIFFFFLITSVSQLSLLFLFFHPSRYWDMKSPQTIAFKRQKLQ